MLVTAVVLPQPPVLVPDVASGAASELDQVREACRDALSHVDQARRDGCDIVVVGGGPERCTFAPGATGSFAGFGVPVEVTLPGVPKQPTTARLPVSLSVASWLMRQVGPWDSAGGTLRAESVPFDLPRADAIALGAAWASSTDRLALVVMGDGSSALSAKAPGYLVPGAEEWQSVVTSALAGGDVATIAQLRQDDSARFGAAGRSAWQVLAGAAAEATVRGNLLASDTRYGVAYVVARWTTDATT